MKVKKRSGHVLWIAVSMISFVVVIGFLMGHYLFNHGEVLTPSVKQPVTQQESKNTASKVARPVGPVTVHAKIHVTAND